MSLKLIPRPEGPFRYVALIALALGVVLVSGLEGQNRGGGRERRTVLIDGREAAEGEVLVRFRTPPDGFEAARAADEVESDEVESIGRRGARRMRSRRLGTRAMLQALRNNPDVEYAEPNYVIKLATLPNDPLMINLWGLFNAGQNILGTPGVVNADSGAHNAWDLATGSRANVVGVIDTGIDYNHPDLAANIWTAPRAFTVVINGVPITCGAGTHGFNAITNSCNPMDDQYHGTHVAGTIGAVGMNGTGVAGVNWVASMMGLKFLDASGNGWTSDAIESIEFAIQAKAALGADANVRILSNSWGGFGSSLSLANQIEAANTANMLFVAAAGNGDWDGIGDNNDIYPFYPASYTNANVVSVASSTNRDLRSSFSNFGAASVDLAAPGSAVYSTMPGASYAYLSGTSMATPHVSGAAALLLSACNYPTTAGLKAALMASVDPVAAFAGITATGGRLNVNTAIRVCPPLLNPVPSITSLAPAIGFVSQPLTLTVNGTGFVSTSVVRLDGVAKATTFVSSTQLTAAIAGGDLPATGPRSISVFSPAPGGGTSGNATLTVQPPPTLTVNGSSAPLTVGTNALMTIAIGGGPANATDWITIAPTGSSGTTYTGIWFLNGASIPPAAGLSNASIIVPAPASEGTYEVRFLANGRYQRLATSAVLTVAAARPAPQLTAISPTELAAGRIGGATIAVTGSGFHSSSQVLFDGVARPTTFNSSTSLSVVVSTADLASVATHAITVSTPGPGGGTSAAATFTVTPAPLAPTVSALNPTSVGAFAASALVTVTGANFTRNSVVIVEGFSPPSSFTVSTTFVSSTQLTVTLSAASLATPGSLGIRVFTPAPGGGLSPQLLLTVVGPQITVNGSAGPVTVGAATGMTVTVANGPANTTDWLTIAPVGSSATTYSGIYFLNGNSVPPPSGLSSATLILPTPAAEGTYEVRFLAAGRYTRLATSGVLTVVIPNPTPQLTAISPQGRIQGSPDTDVIVTGSGFRANSQVRLNGAPRPTTFNSASQLTVTLPSSDLTAIATHTITVHTPAPGGGTSAGATFSVTAMPAVPRLTSISPASVAAGATSLTLSATGTDFAFNSSVVVDGVIRPTTYLSSTALTAVIPASDLATPGTRSIMILTPAPGGGASETRTLTVTGPTMTVNGSGGAISVMPGAAMTVAIVNGPASPYDWITIAPVGSSGTTYNGIWFLNGTGVPPVTGVSSASLVIPAPIAEGTYEVRFLASGRYQRLATSGVITVAYTAPTPQLTAISPAAVAAGTTGVSLVVTGSGFTALSQVLFDGAARSTTFNHSGMLTAALTAADLIAVATHTITVFTPAPGGGTSAGATLDVTIAPPPPPGPSLTVNTTTGPVSVPPGVPLVIGIVNGPANMFDWVTIAPVGSSATTYTGIWFLNGTSVPPSAGVSVATFAVPAPVTPGTYEVRFLGSGRYTRLATSGVITVTP